MGTVEEKDGAILAVTSPALPKISVVTYCHNQFQTLERAVRSVLDQGYPNLEYIVVDGGSNDGSMDLLSQHQDRLQVLSGEGRFASLNRALAQSSGDVLACLDADCYYQPGALQAVGGMFAQLPQVEWLTSLTAAVTDAHGCCIDFTRLPGVSREAFLDGLHLPGAGSLFLGYLSLASTFWRRSLWDKAGPFNEGYSQAGDYDLWGRFFRQTHWLYTCSAPLTCGPMDSRPPLFDQEARDSWARLRLEVHWRNAFKRRLAFLLRLPALPYLSFIPHPFYAFLRSFYQYQARTIVRRRRSSSDAYWAISRFSYLQCALSSWAPYSDH